MPFPHSQANIVQANSNPIPPHLTAPQAWGAGALASEGLTTHHPVVFIPALMPLMVSKFALTTVHEHHVDVLSRKQAVWQGPDCAPAWHQYVGYLLKQ